MHIALTGASGFIGSVLARDLAAAGHTVTALVRASSRRDHIEPHVSRFVVGAQSDVDAWPDLLDGADCLVHNAVDWAPLKSGDMETHLASNLMPSLRLIAAAAPRQIVFMSSIAVHHDMRPRWQGRIDEDHPTRPSTLYGAYKAAVEAHLWALHFRDGLHVCALRPCAVYGLDPTLERTIGHPIVKRVRSERRFTKAGGGKFVHVDDVAALTVATVGNPAASGQVFNMADCYARWADLALMAAEIMGVDAEVDTSSPAQPKNTFGRDACARFGVPLDRGHDGLRAHMRALIEAMDAAG
jgi:nucleoside-diphosphate-sugar epimerase